MMAGRFRPAARPPWETNCGYRRRRGDPFEVGKLLVIGTKTVGSHILSPESTPVPDFLEDDPMARPRKLSGAPGPSRKTMYRRDQVDLIGSIALGLGVDFSDVVRGAVDLALQPGGLDARARFRAELELVWRNLRLSRASASLHAMWDPA